MLLEDWQDALEMNEPEKVIYCATTGLVEGDAMTYMYRNKPSDADAGRALFPYRYKMIVRGEYSKILFLLLTRL